LIYNGKIVIVRKSTINKGTFLAIFNFIQKLGNMRKSCYILQIAVTLLTFLIGISSFNINAGKLKSMYYFAVRLNQFLYDFNRGLSQQA